MINKKNIIFSFFLIIVIGVTFFVTRHYAGILNTTVYFQDEIHLDLSGYSFRGVENAPVTIIELSDFECRHSGKVQSTLDTLHKHLEGVIKHYFKPRSIFEDDTRQLCSRAVLAAKKQDKYWVMKRALFEIDIDEKSPDYHERLMDRIMEKALQCNLDMDIFKKDFNSREITREQQMINREADKYGLTTVPTLLINGTMVKGNRDFDYYLDVIEGKLD